MVICCLCHKGCCLECPPFLCHISQVRGQILTLILDQQTRAQFCTIGGFGSPAQWSFCDFNFLWDIVGPGSSVVITAKVTKHHQCILLFWSIHHRRVGLHLCLSVSPVCSCLLSQLWESCFCYHLFHTFISCQLCWFFVLYCFTVNTGISTVCLFVWRTFMYVITGREKNVCLYST